MQIGGLLFALALLLPQSAKGGDLAEHQQLLDSLDERERELRVELTEIVKYRTEALRSFNTTRSVSIEELGAAYYDITLKPAKWVHSTVNVRKGPGKSHLVIDSLIKNEQAYVDSASGAWTKIFYGESSREYTSYESVSELLKDHFKTGWVYDALLKSSVAPVSRSEPSRPSKIHLRRQNFIAKNQGLSESQIRAIILGKPDIGMTKEMVRASMGDPLDVNRTVSEGLVSEQWVYGSLISNRRYVYFENGVVTSYQD